MKSTEEYIAIEPENGRTDTLIKTIEELERTKKQLAIAVDVICTVKHQSELLILKNGLSPTGDRAVMKAFLNYINRAEKEIGCKFEELEK